MSVSCGADAEAAEVIPRDAAHVSVTPERLAYVVSVLCTLFPLDMVVFSGPQETMTERFIAATEGALHRCLNGAQAPWLEWLHLNGSGSLSATCADHVRRTILLQE